MSLKSGRAAQRRENRKAGIWARNLPWLSVSLDTPPLPSPALCKENFGLEKVNDQQESFWELESN